MDFLKDEIFKDEVNEKTSQKIKVEKLPEGTELRFNTEEDLDKQMQKKRGIFRTYSLL